MKNSLFDPENWIWKPFGRLADFLILSGLWLLCCVPVVTAGAACAALYDCAARCMIGEEREMLSRFFRTFRRELKLGSLSFILWGLILGIALTAIRTFTASAAGTDSNLILAYASVILLALLTGIAAWVFPLLSRFTFRFADLQRTAIKLAIAFLPRTAMLAAVNIAAGWLCMRFLLPVMVVPGIAALLSAAVLEPVFTKYETGTAGVNNE